MMKGGGAGKDKMGGGGKGGTMKGGMMQGYNLEYSKILKSFAKVPITFLGGAGSLLDIKNLLSETGIVGAAAGSFFVFKGRYRAVLINYPSKLEKNNLYNHIIK